FPTELASDSKRRSAEEAAMKPKTESDTALPMVIGVDIGKEVFHLVGFGVDGKIVFGRKIKRLGFAAVFEAIPSRAGMPRQPATSTATADPTSCCRTTAAR